MFSECNETRAYLTIQVNHENEQSQTYSDFTEIWHNNSGS